MAFSKVRIGEKAPEIINTVIEIPRGSNHKYEYNEEIDEIVLDRVVHSPLFYPANYGFVPDTRSEDGDLLDVMVLITDPVFSGCVVEARVIGLLDMEDEKGQDWKVMAVATGDPALKNIKDISDMDEHLKKHIAHFFEVYKHLENKHVTVRGWHGKEEAFKRISDARQRFAGEQK